jgi:autotransporter-associated beta strand protein
LGSITVQAGSLKTAVPAVADNAPAEEPAFHLDATRAETFELIAQNGTNFVKQWTDISGWRNAARRYDTSASRPLPWLRTDDPANGHPVVDFGLRASCRVLVFDKPVSYIRAAYIVIGTQDGCGNFLLGYSGSDICDFHRGGDDTLDDRNRPILGGFDFSQPLRDGLIYIDGVQTNYTAGLSGGYQLVEFHPVAGMRAAGLACDRYGGTTSVGDLNSESARRTGGQRLGEVILYDRPLSERERMATRNYLLKKWMNRAPAALPADPTNALRQITVTASSNVTFSVGNAASVFSLSGSGVFEKTGSSLLAIVDASAFTGTLRVAEGTLAITGSQPPAIPELITNGLTFHADATKNVEWVLSAGVQRVTRWGSAVGDGWFAYPKVNQPEYKASQLGGLPVVDLGPMGSLRHMLFCNTNSAVGVTNRIMNIRSIFWVLGSQNGGGYLLGGGTNASSSAAHYNFHRGVKPGSNDVANPITADHYLWGGGSDPKIRETASKTYLNGVATNGTTTGLSGGYDLVGLVMNQSATEAEGFAFDGRYLDTQGYSERSGGQRLAEVLIYNRPLSDSERQRLECHLQQKWSLRPYRAYDGSEMTLSVAAGASVDLAGSAQPVAYLTGAGSVTNGTLQILKGIGAGGAEGEIATLAISGGLTLADSSMIDVDIASPAADKITVTGTGTLGAHVTVNLHNAVSVRGTAVYLTPVIASGTLSGAANVSGWTIAGDLPDGYSASLYTANNTVWLRISRQGFLLLFK